MKLNRKQELLLIDLGLRWLLEHLPQALTATAAVKPVAHKPRKKKRKWSSEQRKKFAASMKKVWERKKAQAKK